MTMKNLLPPRPPDAVRRASVEGDLLKGLAGQRSRPKRSRLRSAAIGAAVLATFAGAGTAAAAGFGWINLGSVHHEQPRGNEAVKDKTYPVSKNLQLTITPDHGPRGTTVTIEATGCFDPTGKYHAVSYNAVYALQLDTMEQMQQYPHALSTVPVTQTGGNLTGRFTVTYAPIHTGMFFVQCGASSQMKQFTVTDVAGR
ncbi:MAG: hypothetical protein NVSMB48_01810 [Marmoricola sp.]